MDIFSRKGAALINGFEERKCCFCQSQNSKEITPKGFDGKKYECDLCGTYSITGKALAELRKKRSEELKNEDDSQLLTFDKLASVAAELKLKGKDGYTVSTYSSPSENMVGYNFLLELYPPDFMAQLDRTLLNIAQLTNFNPIKKVNLLEQHKYYTYCNEIEDSVSLLEILKGKGDIDYVYDPASKFEIKVGNLHLTLQGLESVRKIQLRQNEGSYAFVAMSFGKQARLKYFRKNVEIAVRLAGYGCVIIDQYQHNNYIMDEVRNQIHQSKFVVADFTCSPETTDKKGCVKNGVRGGVYLEAGLAMGKEKNVIFTCFDDNDSKARLHFDIAQINTIFWTSSKLQNKDSLIFRLYHRIVQTIGLGPLPVDDKMQEEYKWVYDLEDQIGKGI